MEGEEGGGIEVVNVVFFYGGESVCMKVYVAMKGGNAYRPCAL